MNALALALVVAAAAPTAGDVEIAAAQAEAEAFVALKQQRDCDAADAFLRAHTQLAEDTFLTNADLVLERAGDAASARFVFAHPVVDGGARAASLAVRAGAPRIAYVAWMVGCGSRHAASDSAVFVSGVAEGGTWTGSTSS